MTEAGWMRRTNSFFVSQQAYLSLAFALQRSTLALLLEVQPEIYEGRNVGRYATRLLSPQADSVGPRHEGSLSATQQDLPDESG